MNGVKTKKNNAKHLKTKTRLNKGRKKERKKERN